MKIFPNFFIVGAARSGTTSLDFYLSQHPEIYITPRKETHFFARDFLPPSYTGPGDERMNQLLIRDEDQYMQLFADAAEAKAVGEASAFYLCYPGSAERIAQAIPRAKIIIILREPVDRIHSAYMFLVRDSRETLGFKEGLARETERKAKDFEPMWWYRELSQYYSQVKHYLDVFGTQQVKVVLYEEFFAQPGKILPEIFAFLGVNENVTINTSVRYNVSGTPKSQILYNRLDKFMFNPSPLEKRLKSLVPSNLRAAWASKLIGLTVERASIEPQMQARLRADFAEDVKKLEDLLGRNCWQYHESGLVQKS
jgi:hypothetical protein